MQQPGAPTMPEPRADARVAGVCGQQRAPWRSRSRDAGEESPEHGSGPGLVVSVTLPERAQSGGDMFAVAGVSTCPRRNQPSHTPALTRKSRCVRRPWDKEKPD